VVFVAVNEAVVPADRLADLLSLVTIATQRLLGDTITVPDEAWRGPSRLPGWTRGHVGTHIARQADGLVRVAGGALSGSRVPMYASPEQRENDIEAGAGRSSLDLQVDLDTSAEHLTEAFDALETAQAWSVTVELRGGVELPARLLPLARLTEVVLHHVDLDVGYDIDDVDETTAEWLLEWCAFRAGQRGDYPALRLLSDTGASVTLGPPAEAVPVRGRAAHLLGWITGRSPSDSLSGAEDIKLPAF
jgi:maleylpyruvate isomerase